MLAQVVAGRLDVLGGGAERDEDGVGVVALVGIDQPVAAAGELAELGVGLLEEPEDRLVPVVAAGDHAVHVVLLVLHRPEKDRVLQVHHGGHPSTRRAEEFALRRGRTLDEVVFRTQEFAEQVSLGNEVHSFRVGGQHAVLHVHAGVERELVDLAQDDGLVGGLLGILGEQDGPAGVERGVDVVVPAVHVEGVLGESPGPHLEHHGGTFARSVVILLHGIGDPLPGGEVDDPPAGDGHRGRTALGGMLALRLDRDLLISPDVQFTIGVGRLVNLATLGGWRDGIEDPSFREPDLDVLCH